MKLSVHFFTRNPSTLQIKTFLKDMGQPIDSAAFRAIVFDQDEVRQYTVICSIFIPDMGRTGHWPYGLHLLLISILDLTLTLTLPLCVVGHEAFWRC